MLWLAQFMLTLKKLYIVRLMVTSVPFHDLTLMIVLDYWLQDGLKITYDWIKTQVELESSSGADLATKYGTSKVVGTQAPVQLGSLRAADGKE